MQSFGRFDPNLLGVFDAIYEHGGVSGAARHLNLSQPAISYSLARLRDGFGDRLFVREGSRSFLRLRTSAAARRGSRRYSNGCDQTLRSNSRSNASPTGRR